MAFARNHSRVSVVADDPAYDIRPSHWNAAHALSGADVGGIPYCPTATTETTSANLTYTETSGPRLQVGSGSTTLSGIQLGYAGGSGFSGVWPTGVTPSTINGFIVGTTTLTYVNSQSDLTLQVFNAAAKVVINARAGATSATLGANAAGAGFNVAAGTATTDVNALSATQTWNAAGVAFTGWKFTITDTASAAGSLAMQILGGAAGTTVLHEISKGGVTTAGAFKVNSATAPSGAAFYQGANSAQIEFGSTTPVIRWLQGEMDVVQNFILAWGNQTNTFGSSTTQLVLSKQADGVLQVGTTTSNSLGSVRAKFQSSDGTAGATAGPFTVITGITVKDGIVTSLTGS